MENIFVEFLPPWIETGLQPAFYDKESGTVLQQTARMYARVNMLIRMFNKLSKNTKEEVERFETSVNETVENYIEQFNHLHDYVHDYFDNLDVQEEINNKLDEMASDGTLQNIIYQFLQSNVAWTFDTVADMKNSTNLINGAYAQTLGFHTLNDGGGAIYKITNSGTANEMNVIAIGSTLYANLIINPDHLNVKQFGAYGDGEHDDLASIQGCIDYGFSTDNYKIYLPEGSYLVSNAINLYELMELKGNIKDKSIIIKNNNSVDSDTNVDAILILKKSAQSSTSYTRGQHINNLLLSGNSSTTYGIYCPTASPRIEIDDIGVQRVITGIFLRNGWLFAIKDVSINPIQNGIDIGSSDSSTTLNMENVYVNGGSGVGYKIRGVFYSSLTNIACDGNTNNPYYFEYTNLSIDGFGCECPNASNTIYCRHSKVDINNSIIMVNPTSPDYVCINVGTSELLFNKVNFHDYGENNTETAGMFLNCRDRGNTRFVNCSVDKKFATANTYQEPSDSQKMADPRGDYMVMGSANATGLGVLSHREDDFIVKTNQDFHMGCIAFNNRGSARYSLDGVDRRYKPCHDLGDLLVNQAPALNGIAIFQQTSDSRNRDMAGTITTTNIVGNAGTITLTSLDLTDFSKNRGLVVETGRGIIASSGGTATISSIDTGTNTLTLTSVSGTFAVGDSLIYKGNATMGGATFSNIQSIGYGTTAQRPSSPVNGYMYWDTTLGKPIWRVGNNWKDATGSNV